MSLTTWIDIYLTYVTAVDAVIETAPRWGPLVGAVAVLLVVLRLISRHGPAARDRCPDDPAHMTDEEGPHGA